MGKNKVEAPTLPRIRYMCFDLIHAPVACFALPDCLRALPYLLSFLCVALPDFLLGTLLLRLLCCTWYST